MWSTLKRFLGFGGGGRNSKRYQSSSKVVHHRTDHFGDPTRNYNEINKRPYSYSNGYLIETVGEEYEGDLREYNDIEQSQYYTSLYSTDIGKPVSTKSYDSSISNGSSSSEKSNSKKQQKKKNKSKNKVNNKPPPSLPINPDPFCHPYDLPGRMTVVLEPVHSDVIVFR